MHSKVTRADEAISVIRDGDTVLISGFVGIGTPDELLVALEKRFLETGHPRNLTIVFAAAPGDGQDRGLNRIAHEGLIKRAIGGHWSLVPKMGKLKWASWQLKIKLKHTIYHWDVYLKCIASLLVVNPVYEPK